MGEVDLDAIEQECWPTPAGDASIVVVKSGELRALIRLARIGKAVMEGSEETVGRAVVALAKEDPIVAQMLGFKECCELVRSILAELAKAASPVNERKGDA
jgi:hypothetical protein